MAEAMPTMLANFHKTLRNPTVPGGAVDMWEMASEDGETILSVAVVHGRMELPRQMATACNAHADLLAVAEHIDRCCHEGLTSNDIKMLRAAIAKATGAA